MVEVPKTLKHAKSDGWIGLKQWSAQNLKVKDH